MGAARGIRERASGVLQVAPLMTSRNPRLRSPHRNSAGGAQPTPSWTAREHRAVRHAERRVRATPSEAVEALVALTTRQKDLLFDRLLARILREAKGRVSVSGHVWHLRWSLRRAGRVITTWMARFGSCGWPSGHYWIHAGADLIWATAWSVAEEGNNDE